MFKNRTPEPNRILVGIAGIPASGKSTFAQRLIDRVNNSHSRDHEPAILVNLDGWHLTRAQLSAMPNPVEAHARRGAHWTFDGESYLGFLRQLRNSSIVSDIPFPTFSHSAKDPTPSLIPVLPQHRIILIEGLYTFLAVPGSPWETAARMLDERWFISIDLEVAKKRLVKRHVLTGITDTEEEAFLRAENNDLPNGIFIMGNMLEPTLTIPSVEDSDIYE